MPGWETTMLIVAAIVVPIIWGYAVSWAVDRFWPPAKPLPEAPPAPPAPLPHDFHI